MLVPGWTGQNPPHPSQYSRALLQYVVNQTHLGRLTDRSDSIGEYNDSGTTCIGLLEKRRHAESATFQRLAS